MTERTPSQQQLDRANAERRRQRDEHIQFADKVNAEREAENREKRDDRQRLEREQVEDRLRKRFLANGGTASEFNLRKAELIAADLKRQHTEATANETARLRKHAAKAF